MIAAQQGTSAKSSNGGKGIVDREAIQERAQRAAKQAEQRVQQAAAKQQVAATTKPAPLSDDAASLARRVARLESAVDMLRSQNTALQQRVQELEQSKIAAAAAAARPQMTAHGAATRVQAVQRGRQQRAALREQQQLEAELEAELDELEEATVEAAKLYSAALDNPRGAGAVGLVPPGVAEIFTRFDTNQDNVIDYAELRHVLRAFGLDVSSEFASALLLEYDDHPDGKLDIFEFSRLVKDIELLQKQQDAYEQKLHQMKDELEGQLRAALAEEAAAETTNRTHSQHTAAPPPPQAAYPQQQVLVLVTDPSTGQQLLLPLPQGAAGLSPVTPAVLPSYPPQANGMGPRHSVPTR